MKAMTLIPPATQKKSGHSMDLTRFLLAPDTRNRKTATGNIALLTGMHLTRMTIFGDAKTKRLENQLEQLAIQVVQLKTMIVMSLTGQVIP